MQAMSDKIINSFQQRRQLAQAIDEMANTHTEAELLQSVRVIAQAYPAELLLAAVLKHLDTTSSQIRGGLGHLAALLPPEEVTPALRSAAANRQNTPQARITAALIAERFLGDPVPPALLNDLSQTNEVAFQSLREAVDEGKQNRHILLEYVNQMRQTSQDIAFMILNLLERMPEPDRVELMRLIAQEDREPVAVAALHRLETLANTTAAADALRALHTLRFTVPPAQATALERTLRKLQFSGKRYTPSSNLEGWHALLGPADVGGNQAIWLVRMPAAREATGVLIGLIINGQVGVLHTFGSESMAREQLPKSQRVGQMVMVKTDSGEPAVLLEAPFDFGRWRLQCALANHWQVASAHQLPGEYRLYNDLIWQFEAPRVDDTLPRDL